MKRKPKRYTVQYRPRTFGHRSSPRLPTEDEGRPEETILTPKAISRRRTKSQLPQIDVSRQDLTQHRQQAWKALKSALRSKPQVFSLAQRLVRVTCDPRNGPTIEHLTADTLRNLMAEMAIWYRPRPGTSGEAQREPAYPPIVVMKAMLADIDPQIPQLERIVEVPIFGPDGTITFEPGYHPGSKTWYHEVCSVQPVPEHPDRRTVAWARDFLLREFLGDFPFVGPSDLANALALLLVFFVRDMIGGPTPLHVIDALSGPGTGKSLLALALVAVAGRWGSKVLTAPRSEEEWRKRITSTLLSAPSHIIIDNVADSLASENLAALLTTEAWTDRSLGTSQNVTLATRSIWILTGNAVRMSRELARRSVAIHLDARSDQPWQRTGFRHPDLPQWCEANRPALVEAVHVLVRAWIAAGRPKGGQTMGSFQRWADVMGGILQVVGVDGFLENRDRTFQVVDVESAVWQAFVMAWWDKHQETSVSSSDLLHLCLESNLLPDVIGEGSGERSQAIRLGKALGGMLGRQFGIYRIVQRRGDTRNKINAYGLDVVGEPYPSTDPGGARTDADPRSASGGSGSAGIAGRRSRMRGTLASPPTFRHPGHTDTDYPDYPDYPHSDIDERWCEPHGPVVIYPDADELREMARESEAAQRLDELAMRIPRSSNLPKPRSRSRKEA